MLSRIGMVVGALCDEIAKSLEQFRNGLADPK